MANSIPISESSQILTVQQSWVPLRGANSSASEMVSSLLFGEKLEILSREKDWLYVRCLHDQYTGYIPESYLSSNLSVNWNNELHFISQTQYLIIENQGFWLSPGSKIPVDLSEQLVAHKFHNLDWRSFLMQYLNTPYFWGGRSVFGIDCSGLTQVFAEFMGHSIPRDAYQQAEIGETIKFENKIPGDFAFFTNDAGKVTHVGVILEDNKIIHASGKVRIDSLTSEGILHAEDDILTHKLSVIKRVFNEK